MSRRLVSSLNGVGSLYAGDQLLRTTSYELSLWSDDQESGAGVEAATAIDGRIDITVENVDPREREVEHDEGGVSRLEGLHGRVAVAGLGHREHGPAQVAAEHLAHERVVVDDEHGGHPRRVGQDEGRHDHLGKEEKDRRRHA